MTDPDSPDILAQQLATNEKLETALAAVMQAKLEIEARDLQLTNLINGVPAMIAYWGSDLKNIFANELYLKYFGKSPAQVKGIHIRDLLGAAAFDTNQPGYDQVLQGHPATNEVRVQLPGGTIHHMRAHYQPNIINGVVEGFYAVTTDITALKEAEHLLDEAQTSCQDWQLAFQ